MKPDLSDKELTLLRRLLDEEWKTADADRIVRPPGSRYGRELLEHQRMIEQLQIKLGRVR